MIKKFVILMQITLFVLCDQSNCFITYLYRSVIVRFFTPHGEIDLTISHLNLSHVYMLGMILILKIRQYYK